MISKCYLKIKKRGQANAMNDLNTTLQSIKDQRGAFLRQSIIQDFSKQETKYILDELKCRFKVDYNPGTLKSLHYGMANRRSDD
jgi:dTDP-4-dehydrorhamnose 3,5-epimerase-like enzyme